MGEDSDGNNFNDDDEDEDDEGEDEDEEESEGEGKDEQWEVLDIVSSKMAMKEGVMVKEWLVKWAPDRKSGRRHRNTWVFLENLQGCSKLLDAFDKRMAKEAGARAKAKLQAKLQASVKKLAKPTYRVWEQAQANAALKLTGRRSGRKSI